MVKNQHQPTLSKDQIEAIINASTGWYRVLFALLAGTGMRVGEALALEVNDVGSVISVRQNLYQLRLDTTKTEAGEREIDLAPELAGMIRRILEVGALGLSIHTEAGLSCREMSFGCYTAF